MSQGFLPSGGLSLADVAVGPQFWDTIFVGLSQSKVNTATPSEPSWHVSLLPHYKMLLHALDVYV